MNFFENLTFPSGILKDSDSSAKALTENVSSEVHKVSVLEQQSSNIEKIKASFESMRADARKVWADHPEVLKEELDSIDRREKITLSYL